MTVLSGNSGIDRFQEEAEARFRAHKRNVVLAGETGVGKSSLINLIANKNIAGASDDYLGCTSEIRNYHTVIGKDSFEIWDTPGLDEGLVASSTARNKLRAFLRNISKTSGIHLLLLCTRGWRVTRTLQNTYKTIRQSMPPDVPIAIVVTGLERQPCMNDWWIKNEAGLARSNVFFDDHACITTVPEDDLPGQFRGRYLESQEIIYELILKNCLSGRPTMNEEIRRIRREVYEAEKGRKKERKTTAPACCPRSRRKVAKFSPSSAHHIVVCNSVIPASDGTTQIAEGVTGEWHSCKLVIRDEVYCFERVTFQQLAERHNRTKCSSDLLIFYMDTQQSAEIQRLMLCRFYALYGRNGHPLLIVIRGLDDHPSASAWWDDYICTGKEDMETVHLACFPSGEAAERRICNPLEDLIVQMCGRCRTMGAARRALKILEGVKEKRVSLRNRIRKRKGQ